APKIGNDARPGELSPDEASGPTSASKHERSEKSAFELGENRLLTLNSFSNDKLQRLQRPKTRRGGCPHPPSGAKLRKLVFMQDQASCARTKRPGLRQHQNTSEARNLLLSSGRIDCSPLTRSAMTNCRCFRGQNTQGLVPEPPH